jgi:hypothetical protein
MLDQLDCVADRYQLIRSRYDAGHDLQASEELAQPSHAQQRRYLQGVRQVHAAAEFVQWLDTDVCPLLRQFFQRPGYRQLARWSIDNLAPGSETEARKLVEAIDRELVQGAQRLATLAKQPLLQSALQAGIERPIVQAQLTADSDIVVNETAGPNIAEFVAQRPWHDLVATRDYFGLAAELNLKNRAAWLGVDSEMIQIGEFSPFIHRHWRLPGDHIARATLTRIDYWCYRLRQLQKECIELLNQNNEAAATICTNVQSSLGNITSLRDRLEELCFKSDESRLRHSAICLAQIYAMYRPGEALKWLGDILEARSLVAMMRYDLEQREEIDVASIAASAITDFSVLYRSDIDADEQIAERLQRIPLIVVAGVGRREIFWRGKLIEVDWQKYGRAWVLFVNLVERAKQGLAIDRFTKLRVSRKDAKAELLKLLPPDLAELITRQQGIYQLHLPKEQIYVVHFELRDQITEICEDSPLIRSAIQPR